MTEQEIRDIMSRVRVGSESLRTRLLQQALAGEPAALYAVQQLRLRMERDGRMVRE